MSVSVLSTTTVSQKCYFILGVVWLLYYSTDDDVGDDDDAGDDECLSEELGWFCEGWPCDQYNQVYE